MNKVKIKLLINDNYPDESHRESFVPKRRHSGDAGYDVRNAGSDIIIDPGDIKVIDLGFSMSFPEGYECQLRPRSGLAGRGLTVVNSPGTIDAGYRGPMKAILGNIGNTRIQLSHGDRCAQLIFNKIESPKPVIVEDLDDTERQEGGFGSTGIN